MQSSDSLSYTYLPEKGSISATSSTIRESRYTGSKLHLLSLCWNVKLLAPCLMADK